MKATAIIAYTFEASTWCAYCMRDHVARRVEALGKNAEFVGVESLLDILAEDAGIDRMDEYTFDSDDFPKVVFAVQVETEESCDQCGEELIPIG